MLFYQALHFFPAALSSNTSFQESVFMPAHESVSSVNIVQGMRTCRYFTEKAACVALLLCRDVVWAL